MFGVGASVVASIHLAHGKVKTARINVTQAVVVSSLLLVAYSLVICLFAPGAARLLINILQSSNKRGKAHRRRPHRRRDGNAQNADAAAVYVRNDDVDELVHRVRQHGRDRREELFLGDGRIRKNRHAQNDDGHDGEKKPERR